MKLDREFVLDRVDTYPVEEDSKIPLHENWKRAGANDIAAHLYLLISVFHLREQDVYDLFEEAEFGNLLIVMLILNENAEGRSDKPLWYRDELGYLHPKKFARIG